MYDCGKVIDHPPLVGARVPKVSLQAPGFVVENRNQAVAFAPFGVTEPLSTTLVFDRLETVDVVTVGAFGVVTDSNEPNVVPTELVAPAQ